MEINKLNEILKWYLTGKVTPFIDSNFCKNRAEFNGRLSSYEAILKNSFSEDCLFLITSSLGEIGNNCFDHNLGFWQSDPGCLFIRDHKFSIICDRGRGIKQSLSVVYDLKKEDKDYISIAFQKVITGRAPEKRGNGLKFVRKNILNCGLGLTCKSGDELFHLGKEYDIFSRDIEMQKNTNTGVFTYIYW
ncbi:MAG: hypothetical protein ACXVCE_12495 [Bacteriovorax sp.]